jgi:cytochrome P450
MLHRIAPALFTSRRGLPESIPGPSPGRFLSTGGALLPWAEDSLGHATRLFNKYGPVTALVRGGGTRHITQSKDCPGTVLCYGADLNKVITSEHETYEKGYLSGSLHPGKNPSPREKPLLSFGAGLFSENGDHHKRHRRLLGPAFSRRRLESYCSQMESLTHAAISSWSVGETRDIASDMRRLTAQIVTRTLFGEVAGDSTEQASRSLKEALDLMGKPLTKLLTHDLPGLPYHRYLDAAAALEKHVQQLIDTKKQDAEETDDMLSALIRARDDESGTRLSDHEILGHISVFFAAGHETTAHGLTWTLLLLASFPEVATRVTDEISRVFGHDRPSFEKLDQLTYLGWVIKESLRLFTPAPWNGRILSRDVELGGHVIPSGTEILFSIYETHRREAIYEAPLEFRPERWEAITPTPFQYSPFSAGPRTCIGAQFATLEMKIILASVLARYRLQMKAPVVTRFAEMVLSPKEGLPMGVHPADGRHTKSVGKFSGNVHEMVAFSVAAGGREH